MKQEIWGVKAPKNKCTDKKCPFHGEINVKKGLFKGKVVKKDINRSATIEWEKSLYVPKYERYEFRKSRLRVHNPACVDAEIGQDVLVGKTRPLSKVKNSVIIKILTDEEKGIVEKVSTKKKKTTKKQASSVPEEDVKKEKEVDEKELVEEKVEEATEDEVSEDNVENNVPEENQESTQDQEPQEVETEETLA